MEDIFTCSLCGKKYNTPEEMARCIFACSEEKRKAEERAKAEKLIKEKAVRKQEILALNDKLKDLVRKYQEDYNDPFIIDELHNFDVDLIGKRRFDDMLDRIFGL